MDVVLEVVSGVHAQTRLDERASFASHTTWIVKDDGVGFQEYERHFAESGSGRGKLLGCLEDLEQLDELRFMVTEVFKVVVIEACVPSSAVVLLDPCQHQARRRGWVFRRTE